MRADNTHHLREAVARRQATTRARAVAALHELKASGNPITVAGLARSAGVARSWLYAQPDLIAEINNHRMGQPGPPRRGHTTAATEASWRQRLELAHQRIRDLSSANTQLRDQLARAHGQLRAERGNRTS